MSIVQFNEGTNIVAINTKTIRLVNLQGAQLNVFFDACQQPAIINFVSAQNAMDNTKLLIKEWEKQST